MRAAAVDIWSQGGKDGVEAPYDRFLTADHQAVATLRPPDPAAGPDVHIVDALGFQFRGAANIIVVVGVAAVDHHVVTFEEWDEAHQCRIDHRRRHHHPGGAGLFQRLCELFERRRPDRPFLDEGLYGFRLEVINDALVAGPQRRRTMLVPMRPSPIMPNSMEFSLLLGSS